MSDLGIIGLGTMGSALARNAAARGLSVSVYNRHGEKTQAFLDRYGDGKPLPSGVPAILDRVQDRLFPKEGLKGFTKLDGFIASLDAPRKVLLMVDANAVDAVIEELMPLLENNDILIDGGNSYFRDTVRRNAELSKQGIRFIGCGISGGEEGALRGPSMMAGGDEETWHIIKPLLEKIAAKDFEGKPCVGHMGASGAGHAVKMVHNGIEYAVMQAMNDVYHFLRYACGLESEKIADIFDGWRKEGLDGYLMEIAVDILRMKDTLSDGALIEKISDVASQKGTGKWTSVEALEHSVPLSSVTAGVETRFHSARKERREALSDVYDAKVMKVTYDKKMAEDLLHALRGSILVAFAQGIELLEALSNGKDFTIDVSEALRVWQGGCIIRMGLLRELREAYTSKSSVSSSLRSESTPPFIKEEELKVSPFVKELAPDVIRGSTPSGMRGEGFFSLLQTELFIAHCQPEYFAPVLMKMVEAKTPHPAIAASYQWLLASTSDPLPTTLIQAMRDYFGAHTYQRTDKEGMFHTEWKQG